MDTFLTGAGHFGFGFVAGTIVFLLLVIIFRKHFFIQVYSPFLPFLFGVIAALPYTFLYQKTCDLPVLVNIFFFYSWVHCQATVIHLLGNLHLIVLICGCIYCFVLVRYIRLVKKVRRYGWKM